MLRLIVLLLVLLNGLYFAWSHEFLRAYGFAPAQPNEPQRMAQQIKPEAIALLSASELKKLESQLSAEQAPKECLQAGPFSDAEAAALRKVLDGALPSASWELNSVKEPARWVVYMGQYASAEVLAKKRTELAGMGVKAEPVHDPELALGLSLGDFETPAAARAELARLAAKGVRTAKVLQQREESTWNVLKLPAVSEALKAKLADIKPSLAGKVLKSCT